MCIRDSYWTSTEGRSGYYCSCYGLRQSYVFPNSSLFRGRLSGKTAMCVIGCHLCEVRTRVAPLLRTFVNVFHKLRRAIGSIPVVGSSKNTMSGSPISAMAVLNLRLLPPLPHNNPHSRTFPILVKCRKTWLRFHVQTTNDQSFQVGNWSR